MPYALISVSDKTGITTFGKQLIAAGYSLLASGGTRAALIEHGLACTEVSEVTGFPEIMAGRVKTLHPKIHGGILARRDQDSVVLQQHGIPAIDIVVANLYPFIQKMAESPNTDLTEWIDVGGPTLIRAAAKNHRWVTVVTDPADYNTIADQLPAVSDDTRLILAAKAFRMCAQYDSAISNWMAEDKDSVLPDVLTLAGTRSQSLRYGENPHQHAGLYLSGNAGGWNRMEQHSGKALSYNNIVDCEVAMRIVATIPHTACAIIKHANPCGVAINSNLNNAYTNAFHADPESAFGGIVAFNKPVDKSVVTTIINNQFVEVIVAPAVDKHALTALVNKPNVRLITLPLPDLEQLEVKTVSGGFLAQQATKSELQFDHVAGPKPDDAIIADVVFAWHIVAHTKSNAIVLVRNGQTIGIGAGQTSRIQSVRIAIERAHRHGCTDAIMASDAFLPFADNVELAAEHGVRCIVQTGGSIRDDEVLAAADRLGITMLFTGVRQFSH